MSDHFDPYYTWLGIPPEEQPADYYRLLGVRRYESNAEVIVNAADQRMAYLRTFQAGKRGSHSQKLLNEVSAAQVCLLDPAKKRAYDERLSRENAAKEVTRQPAAVVPLPRAQPIQPQVAVPIGPGPTFPRPEAPRSAPMFAQPLVIAPAPRPLQPVVKPKPALPVSPLVLIAASSAAALLLLIVGGVVWASWPRKEKVVVTDPAEKLLVESPRVVGPIKPPVPPDKGPIKPPVENVSPPITPVENSVVPQQLVAPAKAIAPFSPNEAHALQAAWAAHLGLPVEEANKLGMTLRLIPPGRFRMGWTSQAVAAPNGERYVREVELPQAFYMARHEVTVGQFRQFVTASGYQTTAETSGKGVGCWDAGNRKDVYEPQWTWQNLPYPIADDHPVAGVSWDDAQAFCRWLSDKERRSYELPTEVQWEFACRAGSEGAWCFGDDPSLIEQYAWNYPTLRSQPVGTKLANAFDLYDVHGSVAEWCLDTTPDQPDRRSIRGCSINASTRRTPAALQRDHARTEAMNGIGFRIVLTIPNQQTDAGTLASSDNSPPTTSSTPLSPVNVGSAPGEIPVIDPSIVKHVFAYQARSDQVWTRITDDGKYLVIGASSEPLSFAIETATGQPTPLMLGSVFAFSSDGAMLAKGAGIPYQPATVGVARIENGRFKPVSETSFRLQGGASALAFSEDRRILFAACRSSEKLLALNVLKNLEPIPAFKSNLGQVEWLAVKGDTLVCLGLDGNLEVHSIRGRRLISSLKAPAFAQSQAVLLAPKPQKLSLLLFGPEQAIVQGLDGSRTLDRFPLPGLTHPSQLLAVAAQGDLAVLRQNSGLVVWSLAQNKALARIDRQRGFQYAAIDSQRNLLAVEGENNRLVMLDLARLLDRPHWRMPDEGAWASVYPQPRGSFALSTSARPRPGDLPPRPFPGAVPPRIGPPGNDPAAMAAIEALRAKGVQGLESSIVQYIRIAGAELTAAEIDGIKLFPRLHNLDLTQCPCASLVLERLRGLPNLSTIRLHQTSVDDKDMDAAATFIGLRSLDVSRTRVTGAGLAKLKPLVNLTQLSLPDGTAADMLPAVAELTSLEGLNYMPQGIGDAHLVHLGRLTNLRSLSLVQAELQGEGLAHLKQLTQLRQLSLPQNLPASAWPHLADVQFESLHSPDSLGDAELEFLRGNRVLKDLTPSPRITDAGLRTLATFPALEKLSLIMCDQLTGEGLATLSEFPALKHVEAPRELDPDALRHLVQIRGLERLSLTLCSREMPLAALAAHPNLQTLELGKSATDDDCAILARMPALAEIRLEQCSITVAGISRLRTMPRLERLNLVLVKLGPSEAQALSTLTQLKSLYLHKTGLDRGQLDKIRTSIPMLSLSWSD